MLKTKTEKFYVAAIAVVAGVLIVLLIAGILGKREKIVEQKPELPVKHDTEVVYKTVEKLVEVEKSISVDVIQDGINDMGTLITGEYYFTEVIEYSSVKKFLRTDYELKFTESSYLASYDGVVTAGLDFEEIKISIDEEAGLIKVFLPKTEIMNIDIDPNSFKLYEEKSGLGNPVSAEDFNRSLVELENTAREKALSRGLIERADENARTVITNFIAGFVDMSRYKLEYETV